MPVSKSVTTDANTSRTIDVARVVCILFMITVHFWPGVERFLSAADTFAERLVFGVVVDHLGRASVPLLSVFSGMLFVGSYYRSENAVRLLADKFRVLILPIALWSLPFLPILAIESMLTGQPPAWPGTSWHFISRIFGIADYPLNDPLQFLREIFVMCVFGTALLMIWRRSVILAALAAFILVSLVHSPGGFILFRPPIATAFLLGMGMVLLGRGDWAPSWRLVLIVLAAYLLAFTVAGETLITDETTGLSEGYLTRIAMCLLIWRVCGDIADRPGTMVARGASALSPHIFVIFCSHKITISFVAGLALLAGWHETDRFYLLLFLLQLPLCIAAGVILSRLLRPFPIFSGGRVRRGAIPGQA